LGEGGFWERARSLAPSPDSKTLPSPALLHPLFILVPLLFPPFLPPGWPVIRANTEIYVDGLGNTANTAKIRDY
jgi:hypothetical protein